MKNTQSKAVLICILIIFVGILAVFWSMDRQFYAVTLIGFFASFASFVIMFLFISRAKCMARMLNGTDLIASWIYSDDETINNIKEIKEENKGLWVMAMISLSLAAIVVLVTVGIAAEVLPISLLISLILIVLNILILKIFMKYDDKNKEDKEFQLRGKKYRNRYVYISSTGIYAHALLHVWKGWGSSLKEINYESASKKLSFTYSYLRPYGFGLYTVTVKVPQDKDYLYAIKNSRLLSDSIVHNL